MRSDYLDYDLPPDLIAQEPCPQRDRSRLMVVRRAEAVIEHHIFADLPDLLASGDLLILNDTRVIPARLLGHRMATGGKWEGLFLREMPDGLWELMCQTRGRLTEGETIAVEPGGLRAKLDPPDAGAPLVGPSPGKRRGVRSTAALRSGAAAALCPQGPRRSGRQ